MDYLSAEYVICFMVYDCDIVLLLSDQCIAGTYMGIIQSDYERFSRSLDKSGAVIADRGYPEA